MRLSREILNIDGAFVFLTAGAAVKRRKGLASNSVRGLRTWQMYGRVSREPGRAAALLRRKDRMGCPVYNKSPAYRSVPLLYEPEKGHEKGNCGRYRYPIPKERRTRQSSGSRSTFIVPLESRETDPWEPVSREGKCHNMESVLGNTAYTRR